MSHSTAEPAVRVQNVYKIFGKRPKDIIRRLKEGEDREDLKELGTAAVIDASFEVAPGEIFVVMGLSGSGKSTLIRTLNGLQPATEGSVSVLGQDIASASVKGLRSIRSRSMAMVFQNFALLPHRTVLENAAYGLEIQGVGSEARRTEAARVLDRVGLQGWHDHYPHELSGGMQQRVGLARALASGNDILLMDEAFSALDPLIRREMQEQLKQLQKELGRTIVFITHDLNEAMYLGDRIAVMKDGRIAQIGTPEDILSRPADEYVASFIADVDRGRALTARSVMLLPRSVDERQRAAAQRTGSVRSDATLQEVVPMALEGEGILAVRDAEGDDVVGYLTTARLLEAMGTRTDFTAAAQDQPPVGEQPASREAGGEA